MCCRHDERLLQKNSRVVQPPPAPQQNAKFHIPVQTQQFGVSLQFIKDNNNGEVIPPVVRQCIEFLSQPDGECVYHILQRSSSCVKGRIFRGVCVESPLIFPSVFCHWNFFNVCIHF
jgi:Rho GTPase-activating protein 1